MSNEELIDSFIQKIQNNEQGIVIQNIILNQEQAQIFGNLLRHYTGSTEMVFNEIEFSDNTGVEARWFSDGIVNSSLERIIIANSPRLLFVFLRQRHTHLKELQIGTSLYFTGAQIQAMIFQLGEFLRSNPTVNRLLLFSEVDEIEIAHLTGDQIPFLRNLEIISTKITTQGLADIVRNVSRYLDVVTLQSPNIDYGILENLFAEYGFEKAYGETFKRIQQREISNFDITLQQIIDNEPEIFVSDVTLTKEQGNVLGHVIDNYYTGSTIMKFSHVTQSDFYGTRKLAEHLSSSLLEELHIENSINLSTNIVTNPFTFFNLKTLILKEDHRPTDANFVQFFLEGLGSFLYSPSLTELNITIDITDEELKSFCLKINEQINYYRSTGNRIFTKLKKLRIFSSLITDASLEQFANTFQFLHFINIESPGITYDYFQTLLNDRGFIRDPNDEHVFLKIPESIQRQIPNNLFGFPENNRIQGMVGDIDIPDNINYTQEEIYQRTNADPLTDSQRRLAQQAIQNTNQHPNHVVLQARDEAKDIFKKIGIVSQAIFNCIDKDEIFTELELLQNKLEKMKRTLWECRKNDDESISGYTFEELKEQQKELVVGKDGMIHLLSTLEQTNYKSPFNNQILAQDELVPLF